jgi:hypothetical protein
MEHFIHPETEEGCLQTTKSQLGQCYAQSLIDFLRLVGELSDGKKTVLINRVFVFCTSEKKTGQRKEYLDKFRKERALERQILNETKRLGRAVDNICSNKKLLYLLHKRIQSMCHESQCKRCLGIPSQLNAEGTNTQRFACWGCCS